MSGRNADRGRGRGRGDGGRGRGAQFSVPTADSRPGRGGGRGGQSDRGGQGDRGRGFDRGNRGFERGGRGFERGGRGGFSGPRGPIEVEVFSHGPGASAQYDARLQKIEDETVKSVLAKTTAGPKNSGTDPPLPLRPGYGTQGRPIALWANYFEMVTPKDLTLFRYSIDIKPDEKGKVPTGKKLKRAIQLLIEQHFPQYQTRIATDYTSNLICQSELPNENQKVYQVLYRLEGEDEPGPRSPTYMMRLKSTGTLTMSQLLDYLSSTNASAMFGSKDEIIQALNIVVGHYPKSASHIFSVGANKHFEFGAEKANLGAGLIAMRGFFVSVRSATARVLLNVQVKHAACYEDGQLGNLMLSYMRSNGQNMLKLAKFLKKLRVRITHIKRKNKAGTEIRRSKVIDSLATPNDGNALQHPPRVPKFGAGSKEVEFFLNDPDEQAGGSQQGPPGSAAKKGKKGQKAGSEATAGGRYISVFDFFKNNYGVIIKDPRLPVVNVGNRQNPSYHPADVCFVEPGQPSGAKLSPEQTKNMITFAVRRPVENARSIVSNGARLLGINPATNTYLSDYGISIAPKLVSVPGRVLVGPIVKYHHGVSAKINNGSWNMRDVKFTTTSKISSWTYLRLSPAMGQDAFRSDEQFAFIIGQFQSKLGEVGVDATSYLRGVQVFLTDDGFENEIDNAIRRFANPAGKASPQLLLVTLPRIDTAIYNRVKLACDVKGGLINVCVGPKFAKDDAQYYANVALKVNLKLGGRNQYVDEPKLGIIAEGKTMVVGIDVTHPSPGSASNAPSVAGMVASVDQYLGQWPAVLKIQGTARQEMVTGLDEMLRSRLVLWAKKNKNSYPENILIYRDGVSEGQYALVLKDELPLLRKACAGIYPATDTKKGLPRMTIMIVGKRHNTRFYPKDKANADRSSNPQNGTVVDRGVTEPRNWDFYLQAHTALQGTARPAHYFNILDEIFRNRPARHPFQNAADVVEDLTHNMCYMFGRATKAVSICPPAYYADLVCERARCYLSNLYDATPSGSVAEGGSRDADSNDLKIHERVKDTMFYI